MIECKSGRVNLYFCFAASFATSALVLWMGYGFSVPKVLLQALLISTIVTIGFAWGLRRKRQ